MLVTIERTAAVLGEFLNRELSKVSDPMRRFGYRFAVGAMVANPSSLKGRARDLGILNDDCMVDTDAVRHGLAGAFADGSMLNVLGLTFSRADGDSLLAMLEG